MTEEVMASSHADAELAVDDEEEAIRKSNAIDWNSLFATVEDPELAEIMRSAIDSAVSILTTGKEVQKLSVIRTLTELLDTDGEDCIEKNVLKEEATNLDLHCEAAVVFKSIITDKRYDEKFPGLNEKLLNYILLNLENQKEYISAAAWLETLVEIADHIPLQAVTDLIVPLAVNQADPGKRVQRRVIATKLVEKLCTIISPQDVRKELAPCAQMLCQDPNPTVRTSIAQRLSVIAQSLNSSTDCVSLLLPCLIELCKDDDAGVREAILNTIAICLPYFTKGNEFDEVVMNEVRLAESRRTVVVPLLRKCTEQAIFLKDESLGVVSRQLGPWLDSLQDVLSDQERKWFLDTYCRIIGLTMNQSITESLTESRNSSVLISRRMCAYNFPCFVKMYGDVHFTERLLPLLEKLASDSDDEVRSAIAAGFHEIVALRPDEPTLIPPFIELIRGGASEVVDRITGSLHKILPTLYKCANSQTSAPKINRSQLDRIVIGCNRLIRGTGSWRSHESYLNNISCIRHLVPPCDLYISFLPMLKQEVLTARALPCRIAAANTLFLMMREHPMKKSRQTVIDFFCHTIAKHESCQRRRLLLDVVPKILEIFSLEFFKTHILEHVLRLANDKISNIRLQLCRTLPKIKGYLVLPDDENTLLEMEKLVRQLLAAEENPNSRQLIQIYACELSRTETIHRASPANKAKLEEEKRLWTELEPVMIEPPKKEEMSKKEHTTVPSKPPTGYRTYEENEKESCCLEAAYLRTLCNDNYWLRTFEWKLFECQQAVSTEHVAIVEQHPSAVQPDEGAEFERNRKETASNVDTHYEYDLNRGFLWSL
ncbi:hypothetical protein QR680_001602 [Steinernema hermaphroditum]|uniref:TOG domain-containing protein n=1 Tax=Steinernema hermaphroditum TaxID=289476 RepID=A0AA39LGA1_9BILA|nr:hypothetical protein QR680_001602 [Steinernema hermaphroditum]